MTTNETFQTFNDIAHKSVEQMSSLGELNVRLFERLAARHVDAVNLAVEHGVRLAKSMTESKGYSDLLKTQMEMSKELSERLISESKENLQMAGEVRDDYRVWFEKSLAEVSADLRKAVPAI